MQPAEYSAAFAPGLTCPRYPAPADVAAHRGKGVVQRYNVYRNNVTVSLPMRMARHEVEELDQVWPALGFASRPAHGS